MTNEGFTGRKDINEAFKNLGFPSLPLQYRSVDIIFYKTIDRIIKIIYNGFGNHVSKSLKSMAANLKNIQYIFRDIYDRAKISVIINRMKFKKLRGIKHYESNKQNFKKRNPNFLFHG